MQYDHACVRSVSVYMAGGHPSLTDNQYVPALSVHVRFVCHCASHGRPQWNFDRLEKHCWASRSPPKGTGKMY